MFFSQGYSQNRFEHSHQNISFLHKKEILCKKNIQKFIFYCCQLLEKKNFSTTQRKVLKTLVNNEFIFHQIDSIYL